MQRRCNMYRFIYGLYFYGPMRVQNPNGTSIGSAVFAQMTAECPYTLQWFARFPLKIAPYPYPYPYIRIKIPLDKSQRECMQLK